MRIERTTAGMGKLEREFDEYLYFYVAGRYLSAVEACRAFKLKKATIITTNMEGEEVYKGVRIRFIKAIDWLLS